MLILSRCGVGELEVLKIPFSQESIGSSPISGIRMSRANSDIHKRT